jgi:uncharacterized membrane protein YeaQ/YmgE (transglycosylase-associated protein family)
VFCTVQAQQCREKREELSHMIVIKTTSLGAILQPGNLLAWLIVGLIAGFFASVFIRGHSSGCIGNIVVGLVGSVIGGILAGLLDLGEFHFWGTVLISFIGASILLAVLQFFTGGRG